MCDVGDWSRAATLPAFSRVVCAATCGARGPDPREGLPPAAEGGSQGGTPGPGPFGATAYKPRCSISPDGSSQEDAASGMPAAMTPFVKMTPCQAPQHPVPHRARAPASPVPARVTVCAGFPGPAVPCPSPTVLSLPGQGMCGCAPGLLYLAVLGRLSRGALVLCLCHSIPVPHQRPQGRAGLGLPRRCSGQAR